MLLHKSGEQVINILSHYQITLPTRLVLLRYLCLFMYGGVQHIVCCIFPVLFMLPVSLNCPLFIAPLVFSDMYLLVLAHCNSNPQICHPHSNTLSWFWANQSFVNTACFATGSILNTLSCALARLVLELPIYHHTGRTCKPLYHKRGCKCKWLDGRFKQA